MGDVPVFFQQVLHRDLGCASYMLGDAGEAVVIDPRWEIEEYLAIADAERATITQVLDTHDHADHVSGRARLARATGARSRRPVGPGPTRGPAPAELGEPPDRARADDRAPAGTPIAAGETLALGSLRVIALATPGHRPEHLSFAVADLSRGSDPWLVITGDSLLVGDVARPDLASAAAEGAAALHETLAGLTALGDHVEVWPGHIGGSLCGGSGLSRKTSSTIGYERRHNPLLDAPQDAFVAGVTASLPCRPPNVERIVAINRAGAGGGAGNPGADPRRALAAGRRGIEALARLLRAGATVLDGRSPAAFDAGHLAGAINLPASAQGVGTRAGWALDPDQSLIVVGEDLAAARRTARLLAAVGFGEPAAVLPADLDAWSAAELPLATASAWDVDRLAGGLRADSVTLVDVRERAEWNAGHVAGSHHLPLNRLPDARAIAPALDGQVTAVACAAGSRAAFAASLLRRAGRPDVVRIDGGGIGDLAQRGVVLTADR